MALWNVINTEWDPEQETVNFGTRQFVVVDSALYDVVTLATVECKDAVVKSEPKVCGSLFDQYMVIAVDNFIHILSDNGQTIMNSFLLDSSMAHMAWSNDGHFLFALTEAGSLTVIHMPGNFLVGTQHLPICNQQNQPVTIHVGHDEIIVLTMNGLLLRMKNVSLEGLDMALSENNHMKAKEIQSKTTYETIKCVLDAQITAAAVVKDQYEQSILVLGTLQGLFLWDFRRNTIVTGSHIDSPITRVEVSTCQQYIVTLDEMERVICYDRDALLPVYYLESIDQLVLSDQDEVAKRTLTVDRDSSGNRCIVMRSFMGSEAEYRVQVNDFCSLLSSAKQHDIVFIEGARDSNGNVTTLRVRSMTEGRPIDRLKRLIGRGKFTEALTFARNFNLDMQQVYAAKATRLMQELSTWADTKPELLDGKFVEWISTLDSITDVNFVVECCLKFAPSSVEFLRESLRYARKRLDLHKTSDQDEENDRLQGITQVCSVQEQLQTFELIYGPQLMDHWYTIDMKDMFNTFIEILDTGEMTSALILWQRHAVEIVTAPSFAEEEAQQLLGSIPSDLKSSDLLPWLQLVLPTLIHLDSDRIPLVVDWIVCKVASMETFEREEWPRNALKFSETLLHSLKAVVSSGSCEPLLLLHETIEVLNELVILFETYKIPITFSKLTQENKLATINLLLNWLPTADDVGPFMDAFLLPFMRRRSMNIDESLLHYIQNLLHNSVNWWHTGQAQWEQIVSTLISYVRSVEVQAKAILAAACQAPVPWSSTIVNLVEKGEKLDHPLANDIEEEHQIVPLKTVLRHYNIHLYDLKDAILMDCIISNIIKQQNRECLEHALVVARMSNIDENHVRTSYLSCLLWNGKDQLLMETLSQLCKEESSICCHKLIYFIEGFLNAYVNKPKATSRQRAEVCMNSLNAIWQCYQTASGRSLDLPLARRITEMRNIYQLMSHHGVPLNTTIYCNAGKRREALRAFCLQLLDKEMDFTRLNRVAHLLLLDEPTALEVQVEVAKEVGREDVMVQCAQRLVICANDLVSAQICYYVAQALNTSSHSVDTLELQSQLASKAATYCSGDCLLDISELCRLVNLRLHIMKRSSEVGSSPDVYRSLSSLGVYQDFTTPILNRDIMKYLSAAQARVLPEHRPARDASSVVGLSARVPLTDAAEALREFAKECLSVIQVLRGCRQLMPALYTAYTSDSLVQLLFSGLTNLDLVNIYNKTIAKHFDELSSQLLIRIMTANRPDVPDMSLATACLLNLGPEDGYKSLVDLVKRSTSDRRRVLYIGFLGRLLCRLAADGGSEDFFDSVLVRCHWNMKLAPYGVHIPIATFDEMMPILDTLVSLEDVPLDLLSAFSSAFQLDIQSAYFARAQFLIATTDGTNFKARSRQVIEIFQHMTFEEIQKLLANARSKISPYNYELQKCLLTFLWKLQPEAMELKTMVELLEFLSDYNRLVPPGVLEKEAAFYRLPGSEDWPLKRLPLYYQIDSSLARNIYREEFHVNNWNVWHESSFLVPMNRDEICMLAVHNSVKRYSKENQDPAQIEEFFLKLKECLDHIENVSFAATCAGEVMQRLTSSPEQYYAAQLHMTMCEKWKKEDDPAGDAAYNRSLKVYRRVQTEESLRYFKLDNPKYTALTPYPERLIRLLYEDSSPDRSKAINSAAENISEIHGVNLKVIKRALIQEWLPPIEQYQPDDFYVENHERNGVNGCHKNSDDRQNEINMERIVCLLSGSDSSALIAFLQEKALNEEERPAVRVRALTALQPTLSEDDMFQRMGLHSYTLTIRIKVLTFLSRLEFLGLVFKEEEFEVTDKAALIRALLQSGGATQRCITLAMDLATYYVIQDADIWKSILQSMVKYNMLDTTQQLYNDIAQIRTLWVNPVMAPVWNLILQAPFKRAGGDADKCVSTLQMLWSCPILEDIDMETLEQCILSHDYPHLIALLLPFVKSAKRMDLIEKLKVMGNPKEVEQKLKNQCIRYPYLRNVQTIIFYSLK